MSSKSTRHHHNQAAESRLIDDSQIEQRAVQIARDEGREIPSADDRARAKEELLAPNESLGDPEVSPELGEEITAWDEAPGARGHKIKDIVPDDETSVGKDLVEKGLRGPRRTQLGEDPLRREDQVRRITQGER
jgi:hypothetical protein